MSVTATPGRDQAYDDFEVQHFMHTYKNSNAVSGNSTVGGSGRWEPVGGLTRDEVAELVARVDNGIFAFQHAGASQNSVIHARYELSLSPDPQVTSVGLINAFAPADDTTGFEQNIGPADGLEVSYEGDGVIANDVLVFHFLHQFNHVSDTAAGVGAGGTMHMPHKDFNFRGMYGTGPIIDQHDTLYEHVDVDMDNPTDSFLYVNQSLVWDVQERT